LGLHSALERRDFLGAEGQLPVDFPLKGRIFPEPKKSGPPGSHDERAGAMPSFFFPQSSPAFPKKGAGAKPAESSSPDPQDLPGGLLYRKERTICRANM